MKLIPLSKKGKHANKYFTIVDDELYDELNSIDWKVQITKHSNYANSNKYGSLHRYIMKVTDTNIFVDHVNRNSLDNQRHNLRIATRGENRINSKKNDNSTSKFKGVCFFPKNNKNYPWIAYIWKDGKNKHLGYYATEIDAAVAYDNMAKQLYGEFANLNFI